MNQVGDVDIVREVRSRAPEKRMSDSETTGKSSRPLPDLVLASTSVYRRELLERIGVPFRWRAPTCDESALTRERVGMEPRALVEALAWAKASSLVSEEPGATIIGCDQLVNFGGRVFGKPMTFDLAVEQLTLMSGSVHELITAVVVVNHSRVVRHTDVTTLSMRLLTREAIERYVAADSPLDCAGSYKIESRGITLFDRIDSADQTAITGLPLISLISILRELGYRIP
jgi:septum formation protein